MNNVTNDAMEKQQKACRIFGKANGEIRKILLEYGMKEDFPARESERLSEEEFIALGRDQKTRIYPVLQVDRIAAVLRFIEDHPQHWDQTTWHCGTSHCVAGFAQVATAGYGVSSVEGALYYGLTEFESDRLFSGGNSLQDLKDLFEVFKSAKDGKYTMYYRTRDGAYMEGRDRYGEMAGEYFNWEKVASNSYYWYRV